MNADVKKRLRCAVYTRKSTEEGLDQEYNSIDAQRDAGHAYITSQRTEGWIPVGDDFDDPAYSGGNMERPALKRLIADIENRKIDVIVVYKVDRLSRSLSDFARMVDLFDQNGVSFVSVTQQFNTTTSMGRLTLNILLSFAQFEREVTGERIRDKIAASKAKGMWMGGVPPLGYDVLDRRLIINHGEAKLVKRIFVRFLALGSTTDLVKELKVENVCAKSWTAQSGRERIGMVALLTSESLNVFVLLDTERDQNVVFVSEAFDPHPNEADIEDLLDPAIYEALVRESYGTELMGKTLKLNENIPRVAKRLELGLSELGILRIADDGYGRTSLCEKWIAER